NFDTLQLDAEFIDDLLPAEIQPTAILMNPPFSATGGRVAKHSAQYGARHIESALRRLHKGGRLVAITGEGMRFQVSAFSEWWQRIAKTYNVRANLHLSGNEYGKYGTTFDLQILVIDKTGQTPGNNWKEQLENIVWSEAASIEEAWTALCDIAERPEATDQDSAEKTSEEDQTLFVSYAPAKLKGGRPHPAGINDFSPKEEITLPRGVLFSSYSSLIASAKTGERRIDQIQRWLGSAAVVIFDEAHKAKNALASGFGEPTLTGQAVIDLQDPERNPDYRVVYSSATGATDVRNMAYMVRLGLWGVGTSFPGGFQEFMQEIESGGVGAM